MRVSIVSRWMVAMALVAGTHVLVPAVTRAAEEDHLAGYKVKDLNKVAPPLNPYTLVGASGTQSCELKKAQILLQPNSKNDGDDPRGGPAGNFVCYKAKCTGVVPPTTDANTQFGNHSLEKAKPQLVCLPYDPAVGVCGNNTTDGPETCDGTDDAACPGDCEADCTCPAGPRYAGKVDGAPSHWAALPASGGFTGLDAGNAQCVASGLGNHVCNYEEVLTALANGEFAAVPQGTTAWVHRTTTAEVSGLPSPPGSGGRCLDWTYTNDLLADGEYLTFDTAGIPTMHLDNDTTSDGSNSHTIPGDLDCAGAIRSILCCFP